MFLLKEKGKITQIHRVITFEGVERVLEKPSLCANCVVCGCARKIELDEVITALETEESLYVGTCTKHKAGKKPVPIENGKVYRDGNNAVTLRHPNVRHAFIR